MAVTRSPDLFRRIKSYVGDWFRAEDQDLKFFMVRYLTLSGYAESRGLFPRRWFCAEPAITTDFGSKMGAV